MVILFNPRSANAKYRIPNSILSVAAAIEGRYAYAFVDGNLETNPLAKIEAYLKTGNFRYFGCTVMPGPQLREAIPISKYIRQHFPHVQIVWGGYFASNQYKVVLQSEYVDYVVNGPGDRTFPLLLDALESGVAELSTIKNLIYKDKEQILKTPREELLDQDGLPQLPYEKLHNFYPIPRYLGKTYLGTKTAAYHSSFGCPFTCSFCAVVPIYNARWKGKSAENIFHDVAYLKEKFGANAIEFHDNNFFVSEKRAVAFANMVKPLGIKWWGEARIDTMDKYTDDSLRRLREGGCVMIFFGAESGNDEVLKKMDKGGKQNRAQIIAFAARLARFDIVPEYSFVLGTPAETPEEVEKQIDAEIDFIREIKVVNPKTEIIIYIFSPVPTEGSDLYSDVLKSGFRFPQKLEEWLSPAWAQFDLRKNPLTPWLQPHMVDKIRNFETVLNGYFPTISDHKLSPMARSVMKALSAIRYKSGYYRHPYEIRLVHKLLKYRQPETEGF